MSLVYISYNNCSTDFTNKSHSFVEAIWKAWHFSDNIKLKGESYRPGVGSLVTLVGCI
jgi:hypothetical protein